MRRTRALGRRRVVLMIYDVVVLITWNGRDAGIHGAPHGVHSDLLTGRLHSTFGVWSWNCAGRARCANRDNNLAGYFEERRDVIAADEIGGRRSPTHVISSRLRLTNLLTRSKIGRVTWCDAHVDAPHPPHGPRTSCWVLLHPAEDVLDVVTRWRRAPFRPRRTQCRRNRIRPPWPR